MILILIFAEALALYGLIGAALALMFHFPPCSLWEIPRLCLTICSRFALSLTVQLSMLCILVSQLESFWHPRLELPLLASESMPPDRETFQCYKSICRNILSDYNWRPGCQSQDQVQNPLTT